MFMEPDETPEQRLQRMLSGAFGTYGPSAPSMGGQVNDLVSNVNAAQQGQFADAASMIGSRLAGGLGGLAAEGGDAPFTSMPPPPPGPYQHYSATANPMSAPAIEAQSNRQYTPMTLPNDPPGFFGGLGASLGGMPQERQPLWSNVSGPAAPDQRVSDWRNDGGVMINDGFGAMPSTANGPGAGYTSQGMDGSVKPIAFSTDADYGARLSTDPYTNPAIQDLIRKQNMAKELQSIGFANDMAKIDKTFANDMAKIDKTMGLRNQGKSDEARRKALITASNPMLSNAAKDAEINSIPDLSEDEKSRIRLATATQTYDPKLKQYVPVGHTNKKTGAVDYSELLTRVPSGMPQEQIRSFLAEDRQVDPDVLDQRIKKIRVSALGDPKNLPPEMRKEYTQFVRLGMMDAITPSKDNDTSQFYGIGGF